MVASFRAFGEMHKILFPLVSLLTSLPAFGSAGPPLITDDPGTPGAGNWEINIAFASETSTDWKTMEAPLVDMNYGVGERIQLKYEVPWEISQNRKNGQIHRGLDRSKTGVKWRIQNKEPTGIALATYPQLEFKSPVSPNARNADAETNAAFLLPFEAEQSSGSWDFNQEIGIEWQGNGRSQLVCGLATSYKFMETTALLAEAHAKGANNSKEISLLANLGTTIQLDSKLTLLLSTGKSLLEPSNDPRRFLVFAGLQIHL